jgi:aminopeptidase-like protein
MLSRYGLWVDWREDWDLNLKTEQIMFNLEGEKSLIDIAYELDLPFESIYGYLDRLYEAGLIDKCPKAA